MYLKSLKLADFAGIPSADLGTFEPGLTVIVGDNEAGKSTLLTALRAAFFQKHRASGEAVKALSPYLASGRPSVELGFDIDGTAYTLKKAFLQRPMAELVWSGGSLSGDAVEEKLAELFRFTHPGAGEPKLDKHQGAFGLLWVEQGRSTGGLDLGAGKDAVTASLEGEVGQILGGERGRNLIAAAKTLQDRFFTNSLRAVSSSPVTAAEKELAAFSEELTGQRQRRDVFEAKLDRLDNRRAALRSLVSDDAVAKAGSALEAAERAVRAASGLQRDVAEATREVEHAKARRDAAVERLGQRDRLIRAKTAAAEALETAREKLTELIATESGAVERRATMEAGRTAVAERAARADRRDDAARAAGDRLRIDREIALLSARLEKGRAVAEALAKLRGKAAGPAVDVRTIAELEAAEQKQREAAARLSVTAPTVIFDLEAGRRAVDGEGRAVESGARRTVAGRSEFVLEGFGRLTVEPGGDAEALARENQTAERALVELLAEAGVSSLGAARQALATAETCKSETASLEKERAALLPEGLDTVQAELVRLERERDALPSVQGDITDGGGHDVATELLDPAGTQRERRAARDALIEAESALERARRDDAARIAERATVEAILTHRGEEAERLARDAAEAEAARTRAALAQDIAASEVERTAKVAVFDLKRAEFERADPETAERTLNAKRKALDNLHTDIGKLKEESLTLEGELRAEGATALGEDIARLEGEIAALEPRLNRLKLEAEASKLLHTTLVEAQRQAREHWLGPIKTEVAPYLRLIHPGAEIELDDTTLEIRGLHRGGVEEEFRRLSAGAREQVAVVTRIALAQVLKKGGHPVTVILDDALVNTDEKRLERMHLVLQKAAEGLQIIVLTCRERDFRGLGAPIIRL